MSFVLDTNICSAFIKRRSGLAHRFIQHAGQLYVPLIVLGELYTWAYRRVDPQPILTAIQQELLPEVKLLAFDEPAAHRYGMIRARLLDRGQVMQTPDLQIAISALVSDFTLVTHNTSDFQHVPDLRIADWLAP